MVGRKMLDWMVSVRNKMPMHLDHPIDEGLITAKARSDEGDG